MFLDIDIDFDLGLITSFPFWVVWLVGDCLVVRKVRRKQNRKVIELA